MITPRTVLRWLRNRPTKDANPDRVEWLTSPWRVVWECFWPLLLVVALIVVLLGVCVVKWLAE